MSRPKAHYSMVIKNHVSGARLKVELIDLLFTHDRQFRVRVNGQWARKVPVASKTIVAKQVRGWLVRHWLKRGQSVIWSEGRGFHTMYFNRSRGVVARLF